MKYIALILVLSCAQKSTQAQSKHQQIKSALGAISNIIGRWNVESEFTPRTGNPVNEKGTYNIEWALDSTYIQWSAQMTNTSTGRVRQFQSWITYKVEDAQYHQIYFYTRTDRQIVTTGTFDINKRKLITTTTFTLPDGVTEVLRSEVSLNNNQEIEQSSYASFDQAPEIHNYQAKWMRIPLE